MQVIILAAGLHRRWGENLKHLQLIEGKPLIARTIETLKGYDVYVVAHDDRIAEVCDCKIINPYNRESALNSFASSRKVWKDRVVCLLGDVIFSPEALEIILSNKDDLQFFGDDGEIFAFVLNIKRKQEVLDGIERVVELMGTGEFGAKFWYLYHYLSGVTPNPQKRKVEGTLFTDILDYTDDVDRPRDYERFLDEYEWARSKG